MKRARIAGLIGFLILPACGGGSSGTPDDPCFPGHLSGRITTPSRDIDIPLTSDLLVAGTIDPQPPAIRSVTVLGIAAKAATDAANFSAWTVTVPIGVLREKEPAEHPPSTNFSVDLVAMVTDSCGGDPEAVGDPVTVEVAAVDAVFVTRLTVAFEFAAEAKTGIADGKSPVIVKVTANPEAAGAEVSLEVKTDFGRLFGDPSPYILTGDHVSDAHVSAAIVSDSPGVVLVKATIADVTTYGSVEFKEPG
jgi:hypothetical protein